MPLYEYECAKDGRFELIRRFSDPPLKKCPKCGGRVEKLASAPAFHLKGTGWYATDYAKKSTAKGGDESKTESKTAEAKKDDKKEASKTSDSSGTKDAKDSAKSTSTKESPAPKGSSPS